MLKPSKGTVKIECLEDCCTEYQLLATIPVQGLGRWYAMTNTPINRRRIEKMRFTVTATQDEAVGISRMYFCGGPAVDKCATGIAQNKTITGFANGAVKDIDTRSATITWSAGKQTDASNESSPLKQFWVRYGTAVNAFGNLIPIGTLEVQGEGWKYKEEVPLYSLTPNTTYFVDIMVNPAMLGCSSPLPPNMPRITFKTLDLNPEDREVFPKSQVNSEAEVSLFPNPTTDGLNVTCPPSAFQRWVLTHTNGIHITEGKVPAEQDVFAISTKTLPSGTYLLTLLGQNQRPVAKVFVVARE